MALDPTEAYGISNDVVSLYAGAELQLLAKMAEHLAVSADRDDWAERQQTEQLRFRSYAQAMQRQLQASAMPAIGRAVQKAGHLGRRRADEDLDDNGVAPVTARPSTERREPTNPRTERAARQAMRDVYALNETVAKVSENLYVKVKMQVGARTTANPGGLRVDAVQQALDVLTARGITGFRDRGGKNWSLATYMEMKSRTVVNQELIDSHTERMKERGFNLLVVSSHPRSAPQCQPYEGQVLSLDGTSGTIEQKNAAGPGTVRVKIKATLESARAQGFQHPNCRHAVSAWIPGASRTFTTEENPEGYAATQKLRAMERGIRDTKRKQSVAVTPEAKRVQAARLRVQQKAIRDHITVHDLKRRPKRERVDLGYTIGDVRPDGVKPPTLPKPKPTPPAAPTPKVASATPKPKPKATLLSDSTRELIEQARTTLPKDRAGWLDTTIKYPRDVNGAKLVPEKLQRHLDTTLSVGKSIRDDAMLRIDKDAVVKKLQAADKKLIANGQAFSPVRDEIRRDIARRESAILQEALAEVRPIGGVKQAARISDMRIADATEGTAEGIAAVRRAEIIFPDAWLQTASDRGELKVGKTDRAFYEGDWDFIAAAETDYHPNYRGAFDSYPDEVMAHELGHRMERAIPGLTHLEFALVRSRSTKNGVLEPMSQVYPGKQGMENEVGYEDDWRHPYAGKVYSTDAMADPATRAAEAFQVGLQDTFGRSTPSGEFDKTSQLQEFVIGAMALL
ncbi:phage minor capsid protein [Rhodococcus sp. 1168]|uniref:phage minor capsid protein n=1 Tax=Rhodococcus sp. 1168 TaxID=2018041 RepID=UPI000A0E32E2|nr:phage minor capsid protein [Rhodococcus sp. 1168]ORI15781.1 hypothetical protein BJI47_01420 [Rhodococcus sp. 1168]